MTQFPDRTRNVDSPRRALFLANRRARRGQVAVGDAVECLQARGLDVIFATPVRPSQFDEQIRRHADRIDLVVIGGGDGTLNAVVDTLVELRLPLGILPLGTANDLARTLGIPKDLSAACDIIADGHLRQIDLGWVNGKHYFNVASLGLSVRITQQLKGDLKRRWGIFAYLLAAARALARSRPFRAEISSGELHWDVRTVQIAVGNGRFYGGGLAVAEDAAIDDQRLDLYSLEVRRWWQVPLLLPALWRGRLDHLAHVRTHHAQAFEIRTRTPRRINTDGEITTSTPATFRVAPAALAVFAPRVEAFPETPQVSLRAPEQPLSS